MTKNNTTGCAEVKPRSNPRILVAPLDWGLGHATRCIPVIHTLLQNEATVLLAGEGAQKKILQQEFPFLEFIELPGYRVSYGHSPASLLVNMLRQTPRLMQCIQQENRWLKRMVAKHKIDAVISDNRFGLSHPDIRTVFITHQLAIRSGLGRWIDSIIQSRNYHYINKFSECWVPDLEGEGSLAGELSQPKQRPAIPVYHTGLLSRFHFWPQEETGNKILILLSGPEPNRTILENLLVQELKDFTGDATLVLGTPGNNNVICLPDNIKVHDHLSAALLQEQMSKAAYVICRSGYSSVMDIAALGKKSILIPTPGQPEQEYLARFLSQKKIGMTISEKKIRLKETLEAAKNFAYELAPVARNERLNERVKFFLESI